MEKNKNTEYASLKNNIEPKKKDKKNGKPISDVLGSYTGIPVGGGMPEQDADDL